MEFYSAFICIKTRMVYAEFEAVEVVTADRPRRQNNTTRNEPSRQILIDHRHFCGIFEGGSSGRLTSGLPRSGTKECRRRAVAAFYLRGKCWAPEATWTARSGRWRPSLLFRRVPKDSWETHGQINHEV